MSEPTPAQVLALWRQGQDTLDIAQELGLYRGYSNNKQPLTLQVPDEARVCQLLEEARFEQWRSAQVAVAS